MKVFSSFPIFLDFFDLSKILFAELRLESGVVGYRRENYTLDLFDFSTNFCMKNKLKMR